MLLLIITEFMDLYVKWQFNCLRFCQSIFIKLHKRHELDPRVFCQVHKLDPTHSGALEAKATAVFAPYPHERNFLLFFNALLYCK